MTVNPGCLLHCKATSQKAGRLQQVMLQQAVLHLQASGTGPAGQREKPTAMPKRSLAHQTGSGQRTGGR